MAKPKTLGGNTLPHFSYVHGLADIAAVKAIANGTATPDQQIRAFKWIVEKGCMTYDETFDPTNERASAFMQGRRFVGTKLVLFTKLNLNAVRKKLDPDAPPTEQG